MPHLPGPPPAAPALFDVTTIAGEPVDGTLARIALDDIELATNARREIDPEGIERLARMRMPRAQLVPGIGPRPAGGNAVLYAGQRRLLAAHPSHKLAENGLQP